MCSVQLFHSEKHTWISKTCRSPDTLNITTACLWDRRGMKAQTTHFKPLYQLSRARESFHTTVQNQRGTLQTEIDLFSPLRKKKVLFILRRQNFNIRSRKFSSHRKVQADTPPTPTSVTHIPAAPVDLLTHYEKLQIDNCRSYPSTLLGRPH